MNIVGYEEDELLARLGPERYAVLRRQATEPPFTGKHLDTRDSGMFVCGVCEAELFSSRAKFDSATGWPSFMEPVSATAVELRTDHSHGMTRTEVVCRRCGSHLGHVFDDGPAPTGERYCINSLALDFEKNA